MTRWHLTSTHCAPQRLGLAPGAVKQHDAFNVFEGGALIILDFALAIDGDDFALRLQVGDLRGAEIEQPPSARDRRPAATSRLERLGNMTIRSSPPHSEMQSRQPCGAKRPVLLLRMLQDQQ